VDLHFLMTLAASFFRFRNEKLFTGRCY